MRYDANVTIPPFAFALGLLAACTPSETRSTLVVSNVNGEEALVRTADDLSPGNIVHMWHYACSSRSSNRCGYRQVGDGIVTAVLSGSPYYAHVQLRPGTQVATGDRATKDGPMFYWASRSTLTIEARTAPRTTARVSARSDRNRRSDEAFDELDRLFDRIGRPIVLVRRPQCRDCCAIDICARIISHVDVLGGAVSFALCWRGSSSGRGKGASQASRGRLPRTFGATRAERSTRRARRRTTFCAARREPLRNVRGRDGGTARRKPSCVRPMCWLCLPAKTCRSPAHLARRRDLHGCARASYAPSRLTTSISSPSPRPGSEPGHRTGHSASKLSKLLRPQRELNPCYRRERPVS
jgi:hypothetical protein